MEQAINPYGGSNSTGPTPDKYGANGQVNEVELDAMANNFEQVAIAPSNGGENKKQRYPSAGAAQQQQAFIAQPPLYGTMYPGTGGYIPGGGMYGGFGVGAAPFIPQAQQQAAIAAAQAAQSHSQKTSPQLSTPGTYSNPSSPYLGVAPASLPAFGSPSSPSPGASSSPGSYKPSGNPYDGSSSPNPYATGNPYAFGALGFGTPGFVGMMPNMGMGLEMGMPGMPSPQMNGMGQFPMQFPVMGSPTLGSPTLTSSQAGRTVYVGNLPSDASVDELLSQVRFGPIDNVKILPEKSCAFISFLDPITAAAFHSDAMMRKIKLHDQELKIGWGKPSAVPAAIIQAVQQSNATRNVYVGNLDESITEETLRDDLSRFGPIDQVKIVRDKNIGFVHFLSIATAVKVVQTLPTEPEWTGRKVNYGKDRCAYVPKNQHQQQQHNMQAAAIGSMTANYSAFGMGGFSPTFGNFSPNGGEMSNVDPNMLPGNRTIYLGNIHPDTTTEDICNAIRGGILQSIRYIEDKHICFITFVEANCAMAFYQTAVFQGLMLLNRRLKIGWGKHSGPTAPGIAMVVQSGGSRNVYVGNIEDFEVFNEERLKEDFSEYGEIELVNTLVPKQCAFVNFTNIAYAIKAIEGIKQNPAYEKLKVAYGKDRCGGSPRLYTRHGDNNHHNSQFNGGSRSPFPDVSTFSDVGTQLEPFDPAAVLSDFAANGDSPPPPPSGATVEESS